MKTILEILAKGDTRPYKAFLDKVIETGINGARLSYGPKDPKFLGSEAGFQACRGLLPDGLGKLLKQAKKEREHARRREDSDLDIAIRKVKMKFTTILEILHAGDRTRFKVMREAAKSWNFNGGHRTAPDQPMQLFVLKAKTRP